MKHKSILALISLALSSCAGQPPSEPQKQVADTYILARSTPADGSVVTGPADQLQLRFARPVRLLEVTVDGPDGLSPMMITAPAEVTDYQVPLPSLTVGKYRVNWRATSAGRSYAGVLNFSVRE